MTTALVLKLQGQIEQLAMEARTQKALTNSLVISHAHFLAACMVQKELITTIRKRCNSDDALVKALQDRVDELDGLFVEEDPPENEDEAVAAVAEASEKVQDLDSEVNTKMVASDALRDVAKKFYTAEIPSEYQEEINISANNLAKRDAQAIKRYHAEMSASTSTMRKEMTDALQNAGRIMAKTRVTWKEAEESVVRREKAKRGETTIDEESEEETPLPFNDD